MKILVLTAELSAKNGWGRYSLAMTGALAKKRIDAMVVIERNGRNESKSDALRMLSGGSLAALWHALRLRRHAKDCDLIHAFAEPYAYVAYWLSKLTGKKYFVTAHGSYGVMPYRLSFFTKYIHRKSFASAEKIFCVSVSAAAD